MTEDLNTKELSDRELLEIMLAELRALNDRVGTLEARTNPLPPNYDERFTALETNVAALQADVHELKIGQRELQADMRDYRAEVRDLRGEQRDLKAGLRQHELERDRQLSELKQRVGTLEELQAA